MKIKTLNSSYLLLVETFLNFSIQIHFFNLLNQLQQGQNSVIYFPLSKYKVENEVLIILKEMKIRIGNLIVNIISHLFHLSFLLLQKFFAFILLLVLAMLIIEEEFKRVFIKFDLICFIYCFLNL